MTSQFKSPLASAKCRKQGAAPALCPIREETKEGGADAYGLPIKIRIMFFEDSRGGGSQKGFPEILARRWGTDK
jgi:hypothetical protein